MKRRILSIITALALCLSLCPTWAFATEADPSLCKHHPEHTEDCGYTAPTEGHDCGHRHTAECYTKGVLPDADGGDYYEIGADTENLLDCHHSHNSECGYVQADPGASCGYVCHICPIEALIAALPEQVTEDNADGVRGQLDHILDLFTALNEDEQDQIDLSRIYALQGALDNANAPMMVAGEINISQTGDNILTAEDGDCPGHTFTGTAQAARIYVESGTHDVTFSNLNITNGAQVGIAPGAAMNLTIDETNTIQASNNLAGIYVPVGATLIINGTGSLNVSGNNSAGIGGATYALDESGSDGDPNCGTVEINGGTVTATGGSTAAGIGGGIDTEGNPGNGGKVTINGGTVTATGGSDSYYGGAGIGGSAGETASDPAGNGGTLTINGGTVNLTAGTHEPQYPAYGFGQGSGSAPGGTCELTLADASYLAEGTTLDPNGKYTINGDPTADMIVVPELVYTGEVLDTSGIKIDDSKTGTGTYFGQTFTVNASADGWTYAINPSEVKAAGDYTVTFSKEGHTSISKTFTVAKSGTQFVGDGEVKTYNGSEETTSFSAGDTITVKATPTATGDAPQKAAARLQGGPGTGQMALYVGDALVSSEAADADADGSYTMTVSASDVLTLGGVEPNGDPITLTAKFVGNDNMADGAGTVEVNITAAAKAERDGTLLGYYDESGLDAALLDKNNEGAVFTLLDNMETELKIRISCTLDLNGKTVHSKGEDDPTLSIYNGTTVTIRGEGTVLSEQGRGFYVGGTATLEGGTFISSGEGYSGVYVRGKLIVTGENVVMRNTGNGNGLSVDSGNEATAQLSAGTYEGGAAAIEIYQGTGTLAGLLNQEGASRVAYYKDNTTLVTEGLDGKTLPSGSYTVKACTHTGEGVCTYAHNENTSTHTKTCLACGYTETGDCGFEKTADPTADSHTGQCPDCKRDRSGAHSFSDWAGNPVARTCTVCGYEQTAVARVEKDSTTTYVGALANAFTEGNSGATVTLLDDVTITEAADRPRINIRCTLNLNGHTIRSDAAGAPPLEVSGYGNVTITGSGEIVSNSDAALYVVGTAVLEGGIFRSGGTYHGAVEVLRGNLSVTGENVVMENTGSGNGLLIYDLEAVRLSAGKYSGAAGAISVSTDAFTLSSLLNQEGTSRVAYYKDNTTLVTEGLDGQTLPSGSYTVKECTHAYQYAHTPGTTVHSQTCPACGDAKTAETCSYDAATGRCACGSTLAVTLPADLALTYDGTAKTPDVTVTVDGTELAAEKYQINYDNNINAGNTAKVTVTAANGSFSGSVSTTFSISKASLTIKANDQAITYGGNIATGMNQVTSTGLASGDTLESVTLEASSDQVAVADKTITPSAAVIKRGGEDVTANYNITYQPGTLTITKSQPTIAFADGYNPSKTYDGQTIPNPVEANLTITGAAFRDVTFAWSATPRDAGTYTLTASIPVTNNTEAAEAVLTVTISPKTVTPTITITPDSYKYTGSAIHPSGSAVKVMDGDTVIPDSEYTLSYGENTQVGQGSVIVTDKENGNYTIARTTGTFAITKADQATLTITGAPGSVTYGDTFQLSVSGGSGTGAVSWAASGATVDNAGNVTITRVGTVIITAAKAGDSNYYGTEGRITLNVSKKALAVSNVDTQNRQYDGTSTVKITGVTLDGIVNGDTVSVSTANLTGTLNGSNVGSYTAVTLPALTLTGGGADNYTLTRPAGAVSTSVTISKATALTPKTGDLAVANNQAHTYTFGLGALRPDLPAGMSFGSGAVTYELGAVSLGSYYTGSGAKIEGQTLTLPIQAVESNEAEGIGTITVTIHTGNFEDMTATINVRSVNKTIPTGAPTLSAATLTYGQPLSTITLRGDMAAGATPVPGKFEWSSPDNRPAVQEAYAAAWVFTPTDNNTYAIVNGTSTIKVVPASVAGAVVTLSPTSFRYDGQTHSPTVTSVKLGDTTLTADTDYTVEIPTETAAGTYTVTITGKGNYTGTAAATFTINPVETGDEFKDESGTTLRLEVETGLSTVPEALKNNAKYDTPAKIEAELRTQVEQVMSNVGENIAVFDVTLQYKDESGAWHTVDPNDFPTEGVTAILPYPDGTGATGYTFTVQHLISSGTQAGTMETLSYTLTADGLQCKFNSLSPVAIGYQAAAKPVDPVNPNPGGGSGGGGSGVSTYAVTVEKSEHGKVTSSRTNASNGSTVTLTVTPDTGYVLDTLTVTDSRGNAIKLTAQGNGKYTFTMPGRAVTVRAAFAPLPDGTACDGGANCPSRGFTDLGSVGTWYHEAVDYVLRNNLMGGYGNGTFGPNDTLTRAQFAQILYNKEGRPAVTGGGIFTDVAPSVWCAPAITWAAERGIVGGYGNGMFGPNDNITREQLAVMLWRYAGSPAATDKELHFTDADKASGYALEALRWAVENGVINGKGGGILDPKGLATRAQTAQMLKNFIESQEDNA